MPVPDGPQWKKNGFGMMKASDLVNLVAYEFPDEGVTNTHQWPSRRYKDVPGALQGMMEMSQEEESLSDDDAHPNLYESIKAQGVKKPVTVRKGANGQLMLMDGHHRVASAHHINPNMPIPVYFE